MWQPVINTNVNSFPHAVAGVSNKSKALTRSYKRDLNFDILIVTCSFIHSCSSQCMSCESDKHHVLLDTICVNFRLLYYKLYQVKMCGLVSQHFELLIDTASWNYAVLMLHSNMNEYHLNRRVLNLLNKIHDSEIELNFLKYLKQKPWFRRLIIEKMKLLCNEQK